MELLKQRIRKDGTVKGNDVLKVDSFLNHQMDVALFEEIGKEFKRLYADCTPGRIFRCREGGLLCSCLRRGGCHERLRRAGRRKKKTKRHGKCHVSHGLN